MVELYVERLDDGEVSTYLADVLEPGDQLEVRGPIGGWFVWRGDAPALGVAGGSGVVPIVAMLRHAEHIGRARLIQVLVSARTMLELPYAEELAAAGARVVLTREDAPSGRAAGRLAATDLTDVLATDSAVYVCGSSGFAEAATTLLMGAGVEAARVRVERFGPSG
jgi:ferredoxin-NADP reductase